jgi:hypothetical protein
MHDDDDGALLFPKDACNEAIGYVVYLVINLY